VCTCAWFMCVRVFVLYFHMPEHAQARHVRERNARRHARKACRTHEDIVGVRDLTRLSKHVQQVIELPVDVPTHLHNHTERMSTPTTGPQTHTGTETDARVQVRNHKQQRDGRVG
jgi:hypothetical protein